MTRGLLSPLWRKQSPPPITGHRDAGFVQLLSIPELAGYLSMRLIQSFAIIGVSAATHVIATSQSHFSKPIGIGDCLARHATNIHVTALQNWFRLVERRYPAGRND